MYLAQRAAQRSAGTRQPVSSSRVAYAWPLARRAPKPARSQVACLAAPALESRDMSDALALDNVRSSLIRQEDSIIFALIERAQFARNAAVYDASALSLPAPGGDGKRVSLLEYMLRETENLHGRVRRYTSPDEHPFFPDAVPPVVLERLEYPGVLHPCAEGININSQILQLYLDRILPAITADADDQNYGSSATLDVAALQALSKRIHYGKFVAEAKFRAQTAEYTALIQARDAEGIMALLTDARVERHVVERVEEKAATFGQDINPAAPTRLPASSAGAPKLKVQPEFLGKLYEEIIMPLTKDVEVDYLLARLG